jgi:hypothetical protein
LDYSTLPAGIGGAATAIAPYVHRLSLFLKKRSKKKEMREMLKGALSALEDMDDAIKELSDCGKDFLQILETIRFPVQLGVADKLYVLTGKWMVANSHLMLGFVKLAQQCQSLARFETVVSDLKYLDRPVYELVMLFARSYKEGKLELTDFPTFLAMFGPKGMDEVVAETKQLVDKNARKLEQVAETIPEPIRTRIPILKRSANELTEATKNIATTNESVIQSLLARAPPWMRTMDEIVEKARKRARDIAIKRANRYPPRKYPPQPNKWPGK